MERRARATVTGEQDTLGVGETTSSGLRAALVLSKMLGNSAVSRGRRCKPSITSVSVSVPSARVRLRGNRACCSAAAAAPLSQEKKQQNQRDKLHPPANVWTNVKAGQRGNFSFISTAAMRFPVKGGVRRGRQLM